MTDIVVTMENKPVRKMRRPRANKSKTKEPEQAVELIAVDPSVESAEPVIEYKKITTRSDDSDEPIEHATKPKRTRKPKKTTEPIVTVDVSSDIVVKEKKPRGRPVVDKWKTIESRIRGNEFHGSDKSALVIFISRVLNANNDFRPSMAQLLKELGHNDIMQVFSFL